MSAKDIAEFQRHAMRELTYLKKVRAAEHAFLADVVDLGLRRKIARHVHPDGGGNTDTMKLVNELFDMLEGYLAAGRVTSA